MKDGGVDIQCYRQSAADSPLLASSLFELQKQGITKWRNPDWLFMIFTLDVMYVA